MSDRRPGPTFGEGLVRHGPHEGPSICAPSPTSRRSPAPTPSHLLFNGRCEEALDFYRRALGAEVTMLVRFKESPKPPAGGAVPRDWAGKVMHAAFRVKGAELTASDGRGEPEVLSLSLNLPDAASVDETFDALAEGGQVLMAPTRTSWSPRFGMLTDRFGIGWMVLSRWLEGPPAPGKACRRLHGMPESP